MAATTFQTKVRNMAGHRKPFGYLGVHGKTLDDGQEFTVDGSLLAQVTAKGKRHVQALLRDLERGDLVVVHTESPLFYDPTLDVTKALEVDNDTVGTTDPSWGAYSSSMT